MRNALINGESVLTADSRSIRICEVDYDSSSELKNITIECTEGGSVIWNQKVKDIGLNPASDVADAFNFDLKGAYWKEGDVAIIAGLSKAVVLRISNGAIVNEIALRFIDKASMELLEIEVDLSYAMLASTKSISLVDLSLREKWNWKSPGPITNAALDDSHVVVKAYDVEDPKTPIIKIRLDLETGKQVN